MQDTEKFQLAHKQIRQEFIKARDGLVRQADAMVTMLMLLDTYYMTMGSPEASEAVAHLTNQALDGLRTMVWLTMGEGTRELPGMATFSDETLSALQTQLTRLTEFVMLK